MDKIEYLKRKIDRRRKNIELFDRAKNADCNYPPDLIYLWDFLQNKNIGVRFCLGMVYNLGFLDGISEHHDMK